MSAPDDRQVAIPVSIARQLHGELRSLISLGQTQVIQSQAKGPAAAELQQCLDQLMALQDTLTRAVHEATRLQATDPALPPLPAPMCGERWRHYKGHEYRIEGIARHSETKEALVVYSDDAEMWVRPLSMWHDAEPKMGGRRRFEKVEGA